MNLTPPSESPEIARLDALEELQVLDTAPEPVFDGLAKTAALTCGVPISLISLVDAERQWFKANIGLTNIAEMPREIAFCAHTIELDGLLEIADASLDARFAENPLVTGPPHIRFYAGAALRLSDGSSVGSLCVIDREPRRLTEQQREVLRHLAAAAVEVLESRRTARELMTSKNLLRETGARAKIGGWEIDVASVTLTCSGQCLCRLGLEPASRPSIETVIERLDTGSRPAFRAAIDRALATGQPWDLELRLHPGDGPPQWIRSVGRAEFDGGRPVRLFGTCQDITERVLGSHELRHAHERMRLATDSGQIGIWEWDFGSGTLDWTRQMYLLYGLPLVPLRLDFTSWTSRLHPEDREAVLETMGLVVENDVDLDIEFRVVWADGQVRHLRATAHIERDPDGRVVKMVGANWDVTPLRELSVELAEQHELLRVTLHSIGDAVITTDAAGVITLFNPAAESLTGWSRAEAIGQPAADILHVLDERSREPIWNPVEISLTSGMLAGPTDQVVLVSRDGRELGIESSVDLIRDAHGDLHGVVLVFRDVTYRRRLVGELRRRATHDALTGLVNRAELETRLAQTLAKAREKRRTSALVYIDLDQFKLVNDACGHAAGDRLLKRVSRLLADVVRPCDTLARLGGDEFAMLLESCGIDEARRIAQRVCECMDEFRFVHDERRFRIGTSIGLVPLDARWATPADAMQAADSSCYAAKDAGRNRVHQWFDSDRALQTRRNDMNWAAQLEHALDENRFVLHAQRIEPLSGEERGVRAEVLVRLRDEEGGLIAPGAFLPAAERFHLATRIDRWVLSHTIDTLVAMADVTSVARLCINLSGQSVGDREFHRDAIAMLKAAGSEICPRFCIEITETAVVTDIIEAKAFIEQLHALGVSVALDDFGAGASSFGYLKSLSVDVLKIDGQFIGNLIDDPLDNAAVRCFVDVAAVMGLETVAEFVDRPEILQRVREIGIGYAQGFLQHRPEPIERVLAAPGDQHVTASAPLDALV